MSLPGAMDTLVAPVRTIQVAGQLSRRSRPRCRGATWTLQEGQTYNLEDTGATQSLQCLCHGLCSAGYFVFPYDNVYVRKYYVIILRERERRVDDSRDFVKIGKYRRMIPLSTRLARNKTESALLSYSRQRLPRPARLYSSPSKRASAQAFDPAASSIPDSYPAFLPAHPKLADATGDVQDNPNTSDMHTFLRSRTPYTILPPPLPQDRDPDLDDLLYTDSPTQDLISAMDACLHNGYDVPRAKEIFDNLRARGAEQILHPRLYASFIEAYLDMALKAPEDKILWVEDAWTLLDLLFGGVEKVSVTSGAYALALIAWLRCVCTSL